MSQTTSVGSDRQSVISRGLAAFGVLVATAVLVAVAGPFGIALAFLTGSVWYLVSSPVAFAVGQLVFVALMPERTLALFFLGQAGLAMFLLGPIVDDDHSLRAVVALLAGGALLGAMTWLGLLTGELWIGAVVLLASGVAIGYLMHRYERVRLGLVEPS